MNTRKESENLYVLLEHTETYKKNITDNIREYNKKIIVDIIDSCNVHTTSIKTNLALNRVQLYDCKENEEKYKYSLIDGWPGLYWIKRNESKTTNERTTK